MIVADANLLLYAAAPVSPQNELARNWLDEQLNGTTAVGLPWHSLLAFLRVITNPRMTSGSVTTEEAWQQVVDWIGNERCGYRDLPNVIAKFLEPCSRFLVCAAILSQTPTSQCFSPAIQHGLTLCSADGDFARFPGLRWVNPLAAG